MLAVVVSMRVKADRLDDFRAAITTQAESSLRDEPGCLRFDVLSVKDDPLAFLLYEIYVDEGAFLVQHRQSAHFAVWNEIASQVLEGQRSTTLAVPIAPHLMAEGAR